MMTTRTLQILAVCTGNICRSPAIERLLASALSEPTATPPDPTSQPPMKYSLSSAGTRAVVGSGISAPMASLLARAGADPTGFTARRLTPDLITSADLVLTATKDHRRAVVGLAPSALRHSFTLLEFANSLLRLDMDHLADIPPADRLGFLTDHALKSRPRLARSNVDLPDPYGQSDAVYHEVFGQIQAGVGLMSAALRA